MADAGHESRNAALPRSGATVLHQFPAEVRAVERSDRQATFRGPDEGLSRQPGAASMIHINSGIDEISPHRRAVDRRAIGAISFLSSQLASDASICSGAKVAVASMTRTRVPVV